MEASYYDKQADGSVLCQLCPHHCHIALGHSGFCRVRYNDQGNLQALNYGQCTSIALDPIEKKPLYRFHPGSRILSIGSWGCNMACTFCQNWEISQADPAYQQITPHDLANLALQYKNSGNIGIAYTYNEPTAGYEFIRETAPLIHNAGLYNVMVTNGYIEEAPLQEIQPYIDAWNIDLKSFSPAFYHDICQADRDSVCRTIRSAAAVSHVELTNLIIPGKNDDVPCFTEMIHWIAAIDDAIPLHITRYFPRYHMAVQPTPIETLCRLAAIAEKKLKYVYIGNVSPEELRSVKNTIKE